VRNLSPPPPVVCYEGHSGLDSSMARILITNKKRPAAFLIGCVRPGPCAASRYGS
jgi:hypothetical protein